jgi:hypothetical protein
MKKLLKYLSPIVLAAFMLAISPLAAFGAANVTLETVDIRIDTPGTTLKIEGPTIDTIVVNSTSTVITMNANGNSVTITNTDRYRFTVEGITDPGTNCGTNTSSLVIPSQASNTAVTVTPSTICASGGGGGGSSTAPAPAPTTTPTTAPSTTTGNVTATAALGGNTTVTASDGVTAKVNVPAAAVSVDTTFTVAPTAKTASSVAAQISAVPSGQQVVGANIYKYDATAAGTSVTSFASAVTLTFTYTDAQVTGLALSSLKVHKYTATGAWVALATTVNTTTKTITATTTSFSYFAIFGSATVGETPVVAPAPTAVSLVDVKGSAIVDGDLIKTATSFDIYIVKLKNNKKFKRLILNPAIFNSYGHLSWSKVKTVSQAVQDAYTESTLVIEVNPDGSVFDPKVYSVTSALNADVGVKHWVNMTAAKFEASGRDWDSIYHINHTEAGKNFYPLGSEITS